MSMFPEMTPELKHSLLLEKITAPKVIAYLKNEDGELTTEKTDEWGTAHLWSALRAVVELHEPTPYGHDTWRACMECSCQDCNTFVVYPCQTIQAIEKELN